MKASLQAVGSASTNFGAADDDYAKFRLAVLGRHVAVGQAIAVGEQH